MFEESKYCSDVMKKRFNKESEMTKKDDEDLEDSTKYYIDGDAKVRDHCHITGTYRGSDNIRVELNHNISIALHNLKNYSSYLIAQELGKFNLKINVIPNGIQEHIGFNINNKLMFIDTFQFLCSSLDILLKINFKGNMQINFKYSSKEFYFKALGLVKEKGIYHYEYMGGFEKFREIALERKVL